MKYKHSLISAVLLLFLPGISPASTIDVSLNTAPLIGHVAGPFSLVFQLTDGSGRGDGNNSITLFSFQLGGGGASGAPAYFGGAIGNIVSGVTLIDNSFLNYFIQPFTPGVNAG